MLRNRWKTVIALVATLALATGIVWAQLQDGAKAPDFTLKDINDQTFQLKKLVSPGKEQKSAVVLTFWATWCPPCRVEAPHLQKLHEDYGPKGVAVVGVAISDNNLTRVRKFVEENKLTYSILWDKDGSKAARKYQFSSIPTLFIIDGSGVIRGVYSGYRAGVEQKIAKQLDDILAEQGFPAILPKHTAM